MKRIMSGLAALVLILCAGMPVLAKGAEWKALNDEAVTLYKQGSYERAVTVAKKALQIAEQEVGPDHPDVATCLNNLAELYRAQGQYAQAEPLLKRSLSIFETTFGPNHSDVATSLKNLAALYKKTGREKEAEILEKRAADILVMKR